MPFLLSDLISNRLILVLVNLFNDGINPDTIIGVIVFAVPVLVSVLLKPFSQAVNVLLSSVSAQRLFSEFLGLLFLCYIYYTTLIKPKSIEFSQILLIPPPNIRPTFCIFPTKKEPARITPDRLRIIYFFFTILICSLSMHFLSIPAYPSSFLRL